MSTESIRSMKNVLVCLLALSAAACGARSEPPRSSSRNVTPIAASAPEPASETPAPEPASETPANEPRREFRPRPSDGFSGVVHETHAGEVVFSQTKIPLEPEEDHPFATEFGLDESIFVRVFLRDSLRNITGAEGIGCSEHHRHLLEIRVDGAAEGEIVGYTRVERSAFDSRTSYSSFTAFNPHPSPMDDADYERSLTDGPLLYPRDGDSVGYALAMGIFANLTPGSHRLQFIAHAECMGSGPEGWGVYRRQAAQGEMQIHVEENDVAEYLERVGPFLAPSAHPDDRGLRESIAEHINQSPDEEFLGSAIFDDEWYVWRRNDGVPRSRQVNVAVVVRSRDGSGCNASVRMFEQEFDQSRPYRTPRSPDTVRLPCANQNQRPSEMLCYHAEVEAVGHPPGRSFPCGNVEGRPER